MMAQEKKSTNNIGKILPICHSRFSRGASWRPPTPRPLSAETTCDVCVFEANRQKMKEALDRARRIVETSNGTLDREWSKMQRMAADFLDLLSDDEISIKTNPHIEGAHKARQWKENNAAEWERLVAAIATSYTRPAVTATVALEVFGELATDKTREMLEIESALENLDL